MRTVFLSVLIALLAFTALAQDKNVAPINWELYSVPDEHVSITFPKLPTRLASYDGCSERMTDTYRAYADVAAYELTVFSNRKYPINNDGCKRRRIPYDNEALKKRLAEIAAQKQSGPPEQFKLAGLDAYQFTTPNLTRVVVNDIEANQRWLELEVQYYPDKVPDLRRFFESIRIDDFSGRNIRTGALVTLGDQGLIQFSETDIGSAIPVDDAAPPGRDAGPPKSSSSPSVQGYRIVVSERAAYTENARKNKVQGTITLRVTLLANGSVGAVDVIGVRLPDGLTEMAIYAARRMVFLPKKVDGKLVSTSIRVQYGFALN